MKSISKTSLFLLVLLSFSKCDEPSMPELPCSDMLFPANGSIVPLGSSVEFSWNPVAVAASYDLFVGVGTPVLVASDLTATTFTYQVPNVADATYTWLAQPKAGNRGAVGCEANASTFSARSLPPLDVEPIDVDVLVLNYDPEMKFSEAPGPLLHEYYLWQDPHVLAEAYIGDVLEASGGLVKYNLVEWKDIREFPKKADGFRYTPLSYLECHGNKASCHQADDLDYYGIMEEHNVADKINEGLVDEVWIFGAPYFGFWESAMAGPKAFYINGGIYQGVPSNKAFAIMGFSYERGPAEMIHDLCHRTEATMSMVYDGWHVDQLTTSWAKFAANQHQSGSATVGTCHWPPNAEAEYDYANMTTVMSSADDWYNYPYLTGKRLPVNAATWSSPSDPLLDSQRGYLKWWFSHLPRREGIAPDDKLNNWWRYVYEFNETVLK